MSMTLPPVSPSDTLRTNSVEPGATQAPIGIAAAPTVLTSALTRYDFPIISAFIHWVSNCLMVLWQYIMSVLFSVRPSAEDVAWKGLLANANAEALSELDNATIQRVCGDTRRGLCRSGSGRSICSELCFDHLERNGCRCFKQLDADLQHCAHVFINGQQFHDSTTIAQELRSRGYEGERLLKVLSCLSQGAVSESATLLYKLFFNLEGPQESRRAPFPDAEENAFRADIYFEGNILQSIHLANRMIVKHAYSGAPLFKVSVVTLIDGSTGRALVTGATEPISNTP